MSELWFSVDVEADGPYPLDYSMLSFGCVALLEDGTIVDTFERNLKTLPYAWEHPDTMEWWKNQPEAWEACRQDQVDAKEAMTDFSSWVEILSNEHNCKPVMVAYPAGFDFTFMYVYLMKFVGKSVFSFNCLDMKTFACSVLNTEFRETTKRNFPKRWKNKKHRHNHVALTDAIGQGELFLKMLKESQDVFRNIDVG